MKELLYPVTFGGAPNKQEIGIISTINYEITVTSHKPHVGLTYSPHLVADLLNVRLLAAGRHHSAPVLSPP